MKKRGFWPWIVLGLALLIPVGMFSGWWKKMNFRKSSAFAKPSFNVKPIQAKTAFGTSPTVPVAAPQISNPPSLEGRPGVGSNTSRPVPANSSPMGGQGEGGAPHPASLPIGERGSQGNSVAGVAAGVSQPAGIPVAAISTAPVQPMADIGFNPKTDRDPLLSPTEMAEMRRRSSPASVNAPTPSRPRRARAVRQVSIEQRVKLMAIVVTPQSTRAIVNDRIVKVGDQILGARIVRITKTKVVFKYKDKQFVKFMPQE